MISDNAQKLLEKRYFLKDENNNLIEHTWNDVCKRVAKNVSSAESKDLQTKWNDIYYEKMNNMEFIPSSPCLFNAGTTSQQLSSCFIVDIEDNIEGIFSTVAECAKIFQKCGGAGFSMHKIRPKGSSCVSSGSNASGVVSFMRIFNSVVNEVKQGNKRNGALKIDLNVDHPEIIDFIHCKDNTSELNNMNISVSITTDFINAVENDLNWDLKFNGKIYKTLKAKDLWNEIISSAWKTGEPGISYQTNMNDGNMNPHISMEVYGNPCHEFVNIPYTSCNLASINLPKCVIDGKLNKDKLADIINITFRFLDDMVTVNKLPLKKIQEMTEKVRPIGLGTMGFANLLYELKIPYNSESGLNFADTLYKNICYYATEYNQKLAKEKGIYPAWKNSKWYDKKIEVRCSSQLSIAPNGSIAFIANTTGGIEPEFALIYQREDNEGTKYYVVNSIFENYLKDNGLYTNEILEKINKNRGSIQGLDDIFPKDIQEVFVVSGDISPEWHVKILATIQKQVDLSISKTVNLPSDATKEDISNIYLMAGKSGIKGITVYRDGCRSGQVLKTNTTDVLKTKKEKIEYTDLPRGFIETVPSDLTYRKYKLRSGCGNLYFFVSVDDDGKIFDCFTNTDGVGGCTINTQANSRLLSAALRGGVPIEYLIEQLDKSGTCPSFSYKRGKGEKLSNGKSCSSAIANVLKEILKEFSDDEVLETKSIDIKIKNKCPECGNDLVFENSCNICKQCGYSHCN